MLPFIFALKNVFRHKVRSAIALSAIIFGEVALLLSGGFISWNLYGMRTATIYSLLGHIQIARSRYFTQGNADPFAFLLPDQTPAYDLVASTPGVKLVMPRLNFAGLISRGDTTVSFIGEGIDAEKEERKARLVSDARINSFLTVSKGEPLSPRDPKGIIIGDGLAGVLGVGIGEKVVLLVSTPSGGVNAVEANVRGLFFTLSKAYNDAAVRLPLALARELLRVSGSHIWMVVLDKTDDTGRIASQFRAAPAVRSAGLEIRPWNQLADFYNKTAQLYTSQMGVLYCIVGLMVVLSIANTMTMSVLERTGEIGTMMALGARRVKVLMLFLHEGIVLGLIGSLGGLAIGLSLAAAISAIGIPMPPAPGMSHGFTAEILIQPGLAGRSVLTSFGTVVLASLFPAWKASRLNVVDALRHSR